MVIFYYVLALIGSFCLEFGIATKSLYDLINELYDHGYKLNMDYFNKLQSKHRKKAHVLYLVPGLNAFLLYFRLKKQINNIKRDPAFINNLQDLTLLDKEVVESEEKDDMTLIDKLKKFILIVGVFKETKVRFSGLDLGVYSDEELEDGSILSDVILEKMETVDEVHKNNEGKLCEQSFYTLSGEYSLSEVYRIDDEAIFIKTPQNTLVAIVNATDEEVKEFFRKSLIVKPRLDTKYHVVSIKPFDKTKLRKGLLEIEYFKNPIDEEIIMEEERVKSL